MTDFLEYIRKYNDLCLRVLPEFWGFELGFTPELKLAEMTVEYSVSGEMFVSQADFDFYGKTLAEAAEQPEEAGHLHFSAHAINHFFSMKLNKETYRCSILRNPAQPENHEALVEALVCVPTAWILKNQGYNGDRIIEKHFDIWTIQLDLMGIPNRVVEMSKGSYYTLKKMTIPSFIDYVKGYRA